MREICPQRHRGTNTSQICCVSQVLDVVFPGRCWIILWMKCALLQTAQGSNSVVTRNSTINFTPCFLFDVIRRLRTFGKSQNPVFFVIQQSDFWKIYKAKIQTKIKYELTIICILCILFMCVHQLWHNEENVKKQNKY